MGVRELFWSFFFSSFLLLFFFFSLSFLTSQRVQHDERRVPQPHQRLRDLRPDLLERVERVPQHLGAAPAEEQRDEVELEVDGAGLEERDVARGAGDGGEVDDAPEGPDAGEDLDD